MLELSDPRILLALIGTLVANLSFVPYFFDVLRGHTKPHALSWLIWSITQGVGAAGLWYGGAGLAAIGVTLTTILVLGIFLLSFTHGTKRVDLGDAAVLVLAIAAIAAWALLDHPVWAVIMVSIVEMLGFIPTLRKSYVEPKSESLFSWAAYCVGMTLLIVSLETYNFLTVTYLATMTGASLTLVLILITRRFRSLS